MWGYQAAPLLDSLHRNHETSSSSPLTALLVCKQVMQSLNFCPVDDEK